MDMGSRTASGMLALLIACATTSTPPPPPPPPQPPPSITLELAVEGDRVGLRPVGACEGTVSGELAITFPDGRVLPWHVDPVEVSERACVHGLGGGGECITRPLTWVALGSLPATVPGVYRITGDQLVLSCAPTTTRVVPVRFAITQPGGVALPLTEDEPAPVIATAPAPPPPRPPDAIELSKRITWTHHQAQGTLEALLLPQQKITPKGRDWTTRWGTLWRAPRAPAVVMSDDRGPSWLEGRTAPGAKPAPVTLDGKAHLVALELEDGVTGQGGDAAVRAWQSGGLIAASWRVVDGPLDVDATLDDAAARWRTHVAAHPTIAQDLARRLDEELGDARGGFGPPAASAEAGYRPTWIPAGGQLVVRYTERRTLIARAKRGRTERVCPPNRPPSFCRDVVHHDERFAHATIAIELVYDRTGKLVSELRAPPVFSVVQP